MDSALNRPWPAPAKLNRFLRIVGRRADGYHSLQTLFQFLDRCDWLRFEPTADGRIERVTDIPEIKPDSDLTVRAAALLRQYTGGGGGVRIHLDKRLPVGGGLGGGSSDAATTLVALNHYWRCGLSLIQLAELGRRLGADVPVFVHGRAAWAEGVGERLTAVAPDRPWFVVLVPPCRVSTAVVFGDPDLTRDSQPRKIRSLVTVADGNDCEPVVFRRYPPVAEAAAWLGQFARARLTGTGCCVFAAFSECRQAQRVASQIPSWLTGFVSRGRNRSALRGRLHVALQQQV